MTDDTLRLTTNAPEMTEALGAALAPLLSLGTLVALRGDLAAGKTCFTRGLVRVLAPEVAVSSPTFTIINDYEGPLTVHHADLYRMITPDDVRDLGYDELFSPEDGITIVEWAERAESLLPETRLDIDFEHAGGDTRTITITNRGLLPETWREALQDALD